MKFFSSRNEKNITSFKKAVLKGISEDGGLFVAESFPKIDIKKVLNLDYLDMAYEIISPFASDIGERELKEAIKSAYADKFPSIQAPLTEADGLYYLELYHGPTLAFKDFALSLLPKFMDIARKDAKKDEKILILTATSGDTGSAALEGFSGLEAIDIAVFFPEDGISQIQKLQMTCNPYDNSYVAGIKGNFDDAQAAVKKIFTDENFVQELKKDGVSLSSANSINIGRLLPQIVYYFYAYKQLLERSDIDLYEEVTFSVPTGNFGDILAGYYAKKMGLPIKKLLVASNENKVLTDFFRTGIYDINRQLKVTNSPSMDIVVSSNLERLLYHKSRDASLVKKLQEDLARDGRFEINEDFSEFYADYCSQEETFETIKEVFDRSSYLIDTHTAVAAKVAKKYAKDQAAKEKIIVLSTASPYKFASSIIKALGLKKSEDAFEDLLEIQKVTKVDIATRLLNLKDSSIYHKSVIEVDDIKSKIKEFIGERNEN